MISFRCACGRFLEAFDAESGTSLDCPWCGASVVVPPSSTVPEARPLEEPQPTHRRRGRLRPPILLVAAAALGFAGYQIWSAGQRRDLARANALYWRIVERCRAIPRVYLTELDPDAICSSLRPLVGPSADALAAEVEAARSPEGLVEAWLAASTRLDPDAGVFLGFTPGRELTRHGPEALRKRAWLTASALRKARALGGEPTVERHLLLRWLEHDLASNHGFRLDSRGDPGVPRPEAILAGIEASFDALLLAGGTKEARFDLLADRLEKVPAVVEEVRRSLGEPSRDAVERTLALLPGHRALLTHWREEARDLAEPLRGRIEKGARAADEALSSCGDFLVRTKATARDPEGDAEFVFFIVAGVECSGRSIADLVAVLEEIASEEGEVEDDGTLPPDPSFGAHLERLRGAVEEARRFVSERDLLTIPEDAPLLVEATPPHHRAWGASAALKTFRFAAKPQVRIWIAPWESPDPWERRVARRSLPLTVAHEAYPGHHAALLVARDKATLLRRLYPSTWTREGWASYCERLALEEGLARGAESSGERLSGRGWLASKALLKLAYAAGAARRVEAEDLFFRWFAGDDGPVQARRDLAFEMASPLGELGYLVGEREVFELRESLRARLGDRFSLKEFHDRFLAKGDTPVPLIAAELAREWR